MEGVCSSGSARLKGLGTVSGAIAASCILPGGMASGLRAATKWLGICAGTNGLGACVGSLRLSGGLAAGILGTSSPGGGLASGLRAATKWLGICGITRGLGASVVGSPRLSGGLAGVLGTSSPGGGLGGAVKGLFPTAWLGGSDGSALETVCAKLSAGAALGACVTVLTPESITGCTRAGPSLGGGVVKCLGLATGAVLRYWVGGSVAACEGVLVCGARACTVLSLEGATTGPRALSGLPTSASGSGGCS